MRIDEQYIERGMEITNKDINIQIEKIFPMRFLFQKKNSAAFSLLPCGS